MHRVLRCVTLALGLSLLAACAHAGATNTAAQQAAATTRLIVAQQKWLAARWQARNEVLAALSAPHRILLSKLIGQLSIAPQPDVASAVRTLDATLDSKEKASIEKVGRTLQASWQPLGQLERQEMVARDPTIHFGKSHLRADAGAGLLDLATSAMFWHTVVEIRKAEGARLGSGWETGTRRTAPLRRDNASRNLKLLPTK